MTILIDATAIILLILSWWIAASSYPHLPAVIPSHFNLKGVADGWAGRWTIFLSPTIGTFIYALNSWVLTRPKVISQTPGGASIPLHLLTLELAGLFAYLTWRISEVALGRAEGLGRWFLPVTLLIIGSTVAWMTMAGKANHLG